MEDQYLSRLKEIEKQLPNIEFGEDTYCKLAEEIKTIYLQVDGSKPNLISKAVSQDEKNFKSSLNLCSFS